MDKTIVQLNVGGAKYSTFLFTIQDTLLSAMFHSDIPRKMIDGYMFVDRDGEMFRHVLNYLRTGDVTCDEKEISQLKKELNYFCIKHHDIPDSKKKERFIKGCEVLFNHHNSVRSTFPFLLQHGSEFRPLSYDMEILKEIFENSEKDEFKTFCFEQNPSISFTHRMLYGGIAWCFW